MAGDINVGKGIDFFICHASEDKTNFVRDLADQLIRSGATVFYDEYSIRYGQSLTASINKGLASARHVVAVLSTSFLEKAWTNAELQAAFNLSLSGQTRLIPVFHDITPEAIRGRYPLIADIKGLPSSLGYEKVAEELLRTAELTPAISYLLIRGNPRWDDRAEEPGWSIYCGSLSFPFKDSATWPKVLVEYGRCGDPAGRLRIALLWNTHICFEVVDLDRRMVRAAADISSWHPHEEHYLFVSLARDPCELVLGIDGDIADMVRCPSLRLPAAFLGRDGGAIGCSVDIDCFCPFTLGALAYYKTVLSVATVREIRKHQIEQSSSSPPFPSPTGE